MEVGRIHCTGQSAHEIRVKILRTESSRNTQRQLAPTEADKSLAHKWWEEQKTQFTQIHVINETIIFLCLLHSVSSLLLCLILWLQNISQLRQASRRVKENHRLIYEMKGIIYTYFRRPWYMRPILRYNVFMKRKRNTLQPRHLLRPRIDECEITKKNIYSHIHSAKSKHRTSQFALHFIQNPQFDVRRWVQRQSVSTEWNEMIHAPWTLNLHIRRR